MDLWVPMIALLFVLLLRLISRYNNSPSTHTKLPALLLPPGPWQLPLIGSLHHILVSRFRDLPHEAIHELPETYGPVMLLRLGAVPTLVVSSSEAAREVLKKYDIFFCSRQRSATIDIISCGGQDIIFSPYNERWRELRKVCMLELFNQRRVLSLRPVREEEAAQIVHSISNHCRDGRPVNLSEKISCMMNDIIVRTAIGGRCEYRDEYLRELDKAVRLTGGFNLADLCPSSRLIRRLSTSAKDVGRCQSNIYRIIDNIIHDRSIASGPDREVDLLGVLLRLQKDGGLQFPLTNEIISAVIFDIFSAGSETSSTTLEWAMSELIKNPRVLHKVQSEVREIFNGQEKLTEDNMIKLSYLHLVIKETLRLHAPNPLLLPRECRETCQVMGYQVPKGTAVFVNVWAMGRDGKYWSNPEEFRPERFDDCNLDFKGTNFEYIPFGAGRRICPGIKLGLVNMELALASLLYHFDWELPGGIKPEELDMTEDYGITVRRKSKLLLHARLSP